MTTEIPTQSGYIDWNIEQGSTFRYTIFWKHGIDQTPVDLTGYSARLSARVNRSDLQPVLELTEGNGLTTNSAEGSVEIHIAALGTEQFTWTSAVYDLELFNANGDVYKLARGKINVLQETTR